MAYFNFPLLLRKKMQVISLAPPCPLNMLQLAGPNDCTVLYAAYILYIYILAIIDTRQDTIRHTSSIINII